MQLGNSLEVVHYELLPEDKTKLINEFKKEGVTAMIGDGVNDAPALATADIGISMGVSGSALATETGDVILMSNDIRKIPEAIKLARKAHWKVIQNIILSFVTKAAILVLAIAGHPLVWAAVLADVGTSLLVILNSMLILKGTQNQEGYKYSAQSASHKYGGKCCKSSAAPYCCEPKQSSSHGCISKCDTGTCRSNNACGNCSKDGHDLEAQNNQFHGCSSVETQYKCVEDQCHHGHCENEPHEEKHSLLDHYSCREEDHLCSEDHVTKHTKNELGKVIENIFVHGSAEGLHESLLKLGEERN